MSLELKHLAPYFPYKLKLKGNDGIYTLIELKEPYKTNNKCLLTAECRFENTIRIRSTVFNRDEKSLIPILRPISDLTNEIIFNREKFNPMQKLSQEFDMSMIEHCFIEQNFTPEFIKTFRFEVVQKLFEWHFDVFGLIEEGLAIDINTLKDD